MNEQNAFDICRDRVLRWLDTFGARYLSDFDWIIPELNVINQSKVISALENSKYIKKYPPLDKSTLAIRQTTLIEITATGVEFINTTSYTKERLIGDLQIKALVVQTDLNHSNIENNRISNHTNILIAIATGIAGIYYFAQLLITFIPDHFYYREAIIILCSSAFSVLEIKILLSIFRKQSQQDKPTN